MSSETMESVIAMEAQTIIDLTDDDGRDVVKVMHDIKVRAQNILATLNEGDPQPCPEYGGDTGEH
jgi:hypothetical protein